MVFLSASIGVLPINHTCAPFCGKHRITPAPCISCYGFENCKSDANTSIAIRLIFLLSISPLTTLSGHFCAISVNETKVDDVYSLRQLFKPYQSMIHFVVAFTFLYLKKAILINNLQQSTIFQRFWYHNVFEKLPIFSFVFRKAV